MDKKFLVLLLDDDHINVENPHFFLTEHFVKFKDNTCHVKNKEFIKLKFSLYCQIDLRDFNNTYADWLCVMLTTNDTKNFITKNISIFDVLLPPPLNQYVYTVPLLFCFASQNTDMNVLEFLDCPLEDFKILFTSMIDKAYSNEQILCAYYFNVAKLSQMTKPIDENYMAIKKLAHKQKQITKVKRTTKIRQKNYQQTDGNNHTNSILMSQKDNEQCHEIPLLSQDKKLEHEQIVYKDNIIKKKSSFYNESVGDDSEEYVHDNYDEILHDFDQMDEDNDDDDDDDDGYFTDRDYDINEMDFDDIDAHSSVSMDSDMDSSEAF